MQWNIRTSTQYEPLYRKQGSALPTHTNENQLADEFADYYKEKSQKNKDIFQPSDYDSYSVPSI